MTWKHIASFRLVPPTSQHVVERASSTSAATDAARAATWHNAPSSSSAAARIQLHVIQSSVVDFCPIEAAPGGGVVPRLQRRAAIVNAANEGCLGGGGVDGAISRAGGPNLAHDRHALPIIQPRHNKVRCPTGQAKITGPGEYGKLHVPYVIHAVGPNYWTYEDDNTSNDNDNGNDNDDSEDDSTADFGANYQQGHELLRSAYLSSLNCAQEHCIQQIAFSLLSAGVYRGRVPLSYVLRIGVQTIQDWVLHTRPWRLSRPPMEKQLPLTENTDCIECLDCSNKQ